MHIQKQIEINDYALFAIVAVTCLLFDGDLTIVVLDQKELKTLEINLIALFPTWNTWWPL